VAAYSTTLQGKYNIAGTEVLTAVVIVEVNGNFGDTHILEECVTSMFKVKQ
jgi:hypothetical protein